MNELHKKLNYESGFCDLNSDEFDPSKHLRLLRIPEYMVVAPIHYSFAIVTL